MKTKTIFLIIFILAFAVMIIYGYFKAVPGAQNEGEGPKIEFASDFFDFGDVEYGKIVRHVFKIKNSGNKILEIRKVATSCACTSARVGKKTLNPEEETELFVKYNTGLMSGAHAKGEQERIIYVKSNDPSSPQAEAVIKAYVK